MISVLTGDIINSRKLPSDVWMNGLKKILNTIGPNPSRWEIYRGDEFQLEIDNPAEALQIAIQIKAYLKTLRLDARMAIGIGEKAIMPKKFPKATELHLCVRENFSKR